MATHGTILYNFKKAFCGEKSLHLPSLSIHCRDRLIKAVFSLHCSFSMRCLVKTPFLEIALKSRELVMLFLRIECYNHAHADGIVYKYMFN